MNYWLFKGNPKIFRIDDRLRDPEPRTSWLVTRYRKDIQAGDIAFIWRTGTDGGIVAVMRIDTPPREMAELPHERPYWVASAEERPQVRVTGVLLHRFSPVSPDSLRSLPDLADLAVFRGWQQATNFRVSPEQGKALTTLLHDICGTGHRLMKVLLARIGFMKFYKGPKPGDEKPIGGGKYNTEGIGHEAYNFLDAGGTLYGYFQPHMKSPYEINLGRIEQGWAEDKIDNVLVIWFATNPIDRGQVVIGWYNNATVYKSFQSPNVRALRENYDYNIKARAEDCVLLPISKRKFPVGHDIEGTKEGNPGQANAFYVLDNQGQAKNLRTPNNAWITRLIEYVETYDGPKISSREDEIQEDMLTAEYSSGGQGFQSDVEVRLMIESHAMATCQKYYSDIGYEVEDVSSNRPYDFILRKNGLSRFVEVKGTQTAGDTIVLTKNEVDLSRTQGDSMVLFIVHSIVMNQKAVKKASGVVSIVEPWRVSDDRLTPISFTYRLS